MAYTLLRNLRSFSNNESGAVTVDWIVLTAAVIGLGGAAMSSVGSGSMTLAGVIGTSLTDSEIASYVEVQSPTITAGQDPQEFWLPSLQRNCSPAIPQPDGSVLGGGCNTDTVTTGYDALYQMSDGSQWTKTFRNTRTYLSDTQDADFTVEQVTKWYNDDYDLVDEPDVGEVEEPKPKVKT